VSGAARRAGTARRPDDRPNGLVAPSLRNTPLRCVVPFVAPSAIARTFPHVTLGRPRAQDDAVWKAHAFRALTRQSHRRQVGTGGPRRDAAERCFEAIQTPGDIGAISRKI
jgi:hypothetical protein